MTADIFVLALLAGVLSSIATWCLCSPLSTLANFDHPNDRSLHAVPIPRAGGLAILGGLYAAILLGMMVVGSGAMVVELKVSQVSVGFWILGMTFLIMAISWWDDYRAIQPGVRLAIHVVAAAGFVRGVGGSSESIPIPFMGDMMLGWMAVPLWFLLIMWGRQLFDSTMGLAEGALVLGVGFVVYVSATGGGTSSLVLSMGIMILCLVWVTNLYNFMDGMDGFAGGMTVIGHGFLSYLAWLGGHHLIFVLSLMVAAAACGFLIWNFPPAKIFMGDVGSMPIGFLTGALAILGIHDRLFDAWVPVLIFSPFVVDATMTLIRRMWSGEKVWQAHRSHYYQRLVLAGWGHRRTVLAEYGLMLWCGGVAVFYQHATEAWRLASLGAWCLVFVLAGVGIMAVERRKVRQQPVV
jgi:UDP-N-acetylmuramyl pentapeptide phosphotransferase/UDP-N-acetylglucosamine-1-phosphate transferase